MRALARRDLHVAKDLLAIPCVDDREYRGSHRLESLPEFESVHGKPPAGAVTDSPRFIISGAFEHVVERGCIECDESEIIHGTPRSRASVDLRISERETLDTR